MKIQKEGGRVLNLPDRLAGKLLAKGKFKEVDTFEKPAKKIKKPAKKPAKKRK